MKGIQQFKHLLTVSHSVTPAYSEKLLVQIQKDKVKFANVIAEHLNMSVSSCPFGVAAWPYKVQKESQFRAAPVKTAVNLTLN